MKLHRPRPPLLAAVALVGLTSLSACATHRPDVMSGPEVRQLSRANNGVVVAVRRVEISDPSPLGLILGAWVGYEVAGHDHHRRHSDDARQVVGALAGAAAGHGIAWLTGTGKGVEIIVRLPNGSLQVVVQGDGAETLRPGDQVAVIDVQRRARVVKLGEG